MNTKHELPNKSNNRNPQTLKPLRQAGQSDQEMVRNLEFQIAAFIGAVIIFVLVIFNEWLTWLMHTPPQPIFWTVFLMIPIIYSIYKIRRLLAERRDWDWGRLGEIEVSDSLDELKKEGYDIFHDIQCEDKGRKFNIDHVIISPHGIFAVETKFPRKRILGNNRVIFDGLSIIRISGHKSDLETVPNAISKASFLANKYLPKETSQKRYHVIPVLVYPSWSVIGNHLGRDAWVLNPGQLKAVISQQPLSLTQEQCNSVSKFLKERNR